MSGHRKGEIAVLKYILLMIAILLPALSSVLCYIFRKESIRKFIVIFSALILFITAGGFVKILMEAGGSIHFDLENVVPSLDLGLIIGWIIKVLDLVLLGYVIMIGIRLKKPLIIVLALLQLIPMMVFEIFGSVHEPETAFIIDYLSLIMILLVSIIGPLITVFAMGYMKEHEHHQHLKVSRQPRFFMVLFIFLAAMNALVMTNNLLWMYFFWEVTTLCSFLLISHDGNTQAVNNAVRALLINLAGGIAFIFGIIFIYQATGTISIDQIAKVQTSGALTGLLPAGLGLLCLAGFTKSAQFPFQSWLLGAMVAPTPVSALLHSSTMVKAGVYLVVRLAPAFGGTLLGKMVAVVGGFTFVAASAVAISQSNAKKVLAYSTIANLGLIVCCAGIGSNVALGAAILLMIFHAVSKGLLFLCVGTVELEIGSRDIEDMQGLMKRMPFTATIMVIGMLSMMLPPFGVLVTKWLAIQAAVNIPIVLIMIVLGSAFTVVFWSKWIGITLTMSYKKKYEIEKMHFSMRSSLAILLFAVFVVSIGIAPLYNIFVAPQLQAFNLADKTWLSGNTANDVVSGASIAVSGAGNLIMGGFGASYFFLILLVLIATIPMFLRRTKEDEIKPPYLCGENIDNDVRGFEFIGPGDKPEHAIVRNYYLTGTFGEKRLTLWANLTAVALIFVMFGVVIR
ncbi:MAG: NADH/Ubiquinone/plastoquinone [Clostridiales bacterium]|jgi:ech hydrogenase subunit A|nr:NADH/Ubiquinone/plastoquinone [Clostridiales bacterium]